jgi:uncharacterized membrane protein YhiD involved in acid resistance
MGFLSNLFSDKSANINEYFADAAMVWIATGSEAAKAAAFAAATTAALGQRQSMSEYLKQMGQSIKDESQDDEAQSAANSLIDLAALIDSKDWSIGDSISAKREAATHDSEAVAALNRFDADYFKRKHPEVLS